MASTFDAQPALLSLCIHLSRGKNVPTYIHALGCPLAVSPLQRARSGFPGLMRILSSQAPPFRRDCDDFTSIVLDGTLYEFLAQLCVDAGVRLPDNAALQRDFVKTSFLRDVIAKRGRYPCEFERVFREAFPAVHRFIRWINKDDHAELIRLLQRLESFVVIENVATRLIDRIPILTLHDAIYSRAQDVQIVEKAFMETFHDLGIILKVKIESEKTPLLER